MIIDRRLNDRNKNAINRQRFLRRYKKQLRDAVSDIVADRSITDMESGAEVGIPVKDISEPRFRIGEGGNRDIVLPGNHSFSEGDRLPRPAGQGSGGGGNGPGDGGGSGNDDFMFSLSAEEFMNLFFDDLELPRLARTVIGDVTQLKYRRAGYTPTGTPANLSVPKSLQKALARRIALTGSLRRELRELRESDGDPAEIEALEQRIKRVPFLDEYDLRFRNRVAEPKPVSRAVMFCLMDVSASMNEFRKDLAKRFYSLLYMFLSRKYEQVELVFIRHTSDAQEVDEDTFFHDTMTGGTVVVSALKLMQEIVADRYPAAEWNIYGAQVSDGDAFGADSEKSRLKLQDVILPACRYFAYVEVVERERKETALGAAYGAIDDERFAMRRVYDRRDVYPVLRDLFQREST